MDLTVMAYATLGLSLFVSAIKVGDWILNADPADDHQRGAVGAGRVRRARGHRLVVARSPAAAGPAR